MAENKTRPTESSVEDFLAGVTDDARRADCQRLLSIMQRATGEEPRMWGKSMVGFGSYHYRYESGREGDWFVTGFAPGRNDLTVYIMSGLHRYSSHLARLGKHKTGKSCLYLKRLADVDVQVLEELIETSVEHIGETQR